MKILQASIVALLLAGFAGAAEAGWTDAAAVGVAPALPSDPSLYSFADLCRLASGEVPAPRAAPLQSVPVSFSVGPQKAAYSFSTGSVPQPGRWPLMLSGLAAAAWVARRRLGYSL
jgi:hypothetical protein